MSLHRENRYLLFLTENYAALDILKQYLHDRKGQHPESMGTPLEPWEMEPFVLFGSSFPKDKEYTQVNCFRPFKAQSFMEITLYVGLSKYQSNKDMYGDWENSDLAELGKLV